jgi:hypothetical protein
VGLVKRLLKEVARERHDAGTNNHLETAAVTKGAVTSTDNK